MRQDRSIHVALGLPVAAATFAVLWHVLPNHALASLLPWEGAGAAWLLTSLGLMARADERLRPTWRLLAVAVVVAVVVLLAVWQIDLAARGKARPLLRTHFKHWIPWLAGAGGALWIGAFATERWLKRRLPIFTSLIFGVAIATVSLQVGKYQYEAFAGERVRAWNVYHYYVGSKYFSELSYFDLYAATLAADDDFIAAREARGKRVHKRFSLITKARDQRDYRVKKREVIVGEFDRSIISSKRLRELGRDSRFIGGYMGFKNPGWHQTFKDLGYDPAPPWTIVGVPVSSVVPTKFPWFGIITNSDVPLYVMTLLLLWWAFGLRVASIMALWLCSAQLNEARFTGGFLQYDWMCTTLSAVALYHRGRHKTSGVVLSWAAMTRVFPGFLIFGLALQAAIAVVRRKAIAPAQWSFLLAFTLSCAALFGASHLTGQGLQTWPEWVDKIGRHTELHAVTSNMRVGVGRLVIHQPSRHGFWSDVPGDRKTKLARSHGRKRVYQAIGGLLLLLALVRRDDLDAIVLMLFLPFLLVVTSRYYASVWALLFVLGASPRGSPKEGSISTYAAVAGGALLLLNATFYTWDTTTIAYYALNYGIYTLFCGLCVAYIAGDVRSVLKQRRAPREAGAEGGHDDLVAGSDAPLLEGQIE